MAVQEQTPYQEITANGVTTSFVLDFDCENKVHLIVTLDGVEPPVGNWSLTGGAVVFTVAPANGVLVTIQRNTPLSRTTDYQSYNNSFRPAPVNKDFDWIWWKLQELWVQITLLWVTLKQEIQDRINGDLAIRAWVGVLLNNIVDNGLVSVIAVTTVDCVDDLQYLTKWEGRAILVKSYYIGLGKGGNSYVYKSELASINNGGTIINGWVSVDSNIDDALQWGAKLDGVTNDTIPFQNALNTVGRVFANGSTVLGRIEVPEGAKISGKLNINYTELPCIPCEFDSNNATNHAKMKAVFVFGVWDLCAMLQLKTAGFNTIVHYGYTFANGGNMTKAINAAEAIGLKVILNSPNDIPPATDVDLINGRESIVGVYIFDEPQLKGVSVAAQNTRINAWRAVTDKSICIADSGVHGFTNDTLANSYDLILVDYYYIAANTDTENKTQCLLSYAEIKYKSRHAKLVPCIGLFVGDAFTNKAKNISFSKSVLGFGGGDLAIYAWDASSSDQNLTDIIGDIDLYNAANLLNNKQEKPAYRIDNIVFDDIGMSGLLRSVNFKYTSADVQPFRVINTGSATDERHQPFGCEGIAARNAGGLIAFNTTDAKFIAAYLIYKNFADASEARVLISKFSDDYLTGSDLIDQTIANDSGFSKGANVSKNNAVGIKFVPSSTSSFFFKFLQGGIVTSDWEQSIF